MPDFSTIPLHTDADVDDWLHFFEMSAPLINIGYMISHDPVSFIAFTQCLY